MKSTRVVATRVRGGRCEADWIGPRGEPRCSLEDRGCQGMVLTTVSDTCGKDGSAAVRRRRSNGTKHRPVCLGVLVQEPMHDPFAHDKDAEVPRDFGWRGINPPVGCKQARPSSKPFAASAISPGPFRGWGRHPLACIHTQREPVVPPAGTGTEYRRPQAVSWHLAALRAKASGDRSRIDGSTSINRTATSAIRWSNDLPALQAVIGPCRTRTPLQKGTRAGESRRAREVCPAVGSSRRGRGRLGRQFALGRRRGVLDVRPEVRLDGPRLPAAASLTGCVPLQSG